VIVVGLVVLRSFEDEKKAKMGIVECVKHSLIEPFTVLYEREGILSFRWLLTFKTSLKLNFNLYTIMLVFNCLTPPFGLGL